MMMLIKPYCWTMYTRTLYGVRTLNVTDSIWCQCWSVGENWHKRKDVSCMLFILWQLSWSVHILRACFLCRSRCFFAYLLVADQTNCNLSRWFVLLTAKIFGNFSNEPLLRVIHFGITFVVVIGSSSYLVLCCLCMCQRIRWLICDQTQIFRIVQSTNAKIPFYSKV